MRFATTAGFQALSPQITALHSGFHSSSKVPRAAEAFARSRTPAVKSVPVCTLVMLAVCVTSRRAPGGGHHVGNASAAVRSYTLFLNPMLVQALPPSVALRLRADVLAEACALRASIIRTTAVCELP